MHAPPQFNLDPFECRLHAVTPGLPVHQKLAPAAFATDEGEPEEGEGFTVCSLPMLRRTSNKITQKLLALLGD